MVKRLWGCRASRWAEIAAAAAAAAAAADTDTAAAAVVGTAAAVVVGTAAAPAVVVGTAAAAPATLNDCGWSLSPLELGGVAVQKCCVNFFNVRNNCA